MTKLDTDLSDISSYFAIDKEQQECVLGEGVTMFGEAQLGPDTWSELPEATNHKVAAGESCTNDNSTTKRAPHEMEAYNEQNFEQNGEVDFNGSFGGGMEQATLDEDGDARMYTMEDIMSYTSSVEPEAMNVFEPMIDATNKDPKTITNPVTTTSMTLATTTTLDATFADTRPLMCKIVFGTDVSNTVHNTAHMAESSYPPHVINTNAPKKSPVSTSIKSTHPGISKTSTGGVIIAKIKTTVVKNIADKNIVVRGKFGTNTLISTGMKHDEQMRLVDIWPTDQGKSKGLYDPKDLYIDVILGVQRLLDNSEKVLSERAYTRKSKNCVNAVVTRRNNKNKQELLQEEIVAGKAENTYLKDEISELKKEILSLRASALR